jgi:hypothetical protein
VQPARPIAVFQFHDRRAVHELDDNAIWLIAGAIQPMSPALMLAGSIVARVAIGTRQFGPALAGSLVLAWLVWLRRQPRSFSLLLAGLPLPLLAAAWQLRTGTVHPNFTQAVLLCREARYVHEAQHS